MHLKITCSLSQNHLHLIGSAQDILGPHFDSGFTNPFRMQSYSAPYIWGLILVLALGPIQVARVPRVIHKVDLAGSGWWISVDVDESGWILMDLGGSGSIWMDLSGIWVGLGGSPVGVWDVFAPVIRQMSLHSAQAAQAGGGFAPPISIFFICMD